LREYTTKTWRTAHIAIRKEGFLHFEVSKRMKEKHYKFVISVKKKRISTLRSEVKLWCVVEKAANDWRQIC